MGRHHFASTAVIAALFAATAGAQDAAVPAGPAAEIRSITGGIGAESREDLDRVADEYSLHVWVATATGAFLSDVAVDIYDAQDDRVFEAITQGPFLYVDLAPGRYRVVATRADGPSDTQSVSVSGRGSPVRLVFRIGPTDG